jgi:hypothetical protein
MIGCRKNFKTDKELGDHRRKHHASSSQTKGT